MKAAEWIDRLKTERGWESDYRVAKELGVGRATVSKYRTSGTTLDEEVAVRVATALGEKPEIIILDQVAERSKAPEVRDAVAAAVERLRGKDLAAPVRRGAGGKGRIDISSIAAITVLALAGWLGSPAPAEAGVGTCASDSTGIRIVSSRRCRRRRYTRPSLRPSLRRRASARA